MTYRVTYAKPDPKGSLRIVSRKVEAPSADRAAAVMRAKGYRVLKVVPVYT